MHVLAASLIVMTFDKELSGGDSGGEPPVPIPNTEVKPASADGTWVGTPWESRTPPDIKLGPSLTSEAAPLFASLPAWFGGRHDHINRRDGARRSSLAVTLKGIPVSDNRSSGGGRKRRNPGRGSGKPGPPRSGGKPNSGGGSKERRGTSGGSGGRGQGTGGSGPGGTGRQEGGRGRSAGTRGGQSRAQRSGGSGGTGGERRPSASGSASARTSGDQHTTNRRPYTAGGGPSNIPRWLRDEIIRVTPKDRRDGVLTLLSEAAADFADEKFGRAHTKLVRAKEMASRAAAIRELLGLTAYRMQRWEEALRELRAFRRMAGDTTHMPVEMDVLRALGRGADVRKTWELYLELGGRPLTDAEARVVYGSFLLDEGDPRGAWEVTKPKRVTKEARLGDLRRWYVAARAAAALGDTATARQLLRVIDEADEHHEVDGLELLDAEIARAEAAST